MTEEIVEDAKTTLKNVKATIAGVDSVAETAEVKVKAWYKSYPFYAGFIVGAVVALLVRHFI